MPKARISSARLEVIHELVILAARLDGAARKLVLDLLVEVTNS